MADLPQDQHASAENTPTPAPQDLYSEYKIPERLLLGSKQSDFILGFGLSAVLSLLCLVTVGLTLILIPILRSTDEFKHYPVVMNGMMYGSAVTLCLMAVVLLAEAIYYLIHNQYIVL
jgi:hypothetical protein